MRLSVPLVVVLAACGTSTPGSVSTGHGDGDPTSPVTDPGVDPGDRGEVPVGIWPTPGLRAAIPISGLRAPSGAIVTSANTFYVYAPDVDNASLVRIDRRTNAVTSLALGGEPARMVTVGDDVWVTLRDAGQLVRVGLDAQGAMVEKDRVDLGAEPYDVVVSFEAKRLYVALSQEDAVIALDAETLEVVGRWAVPGEPKWLAAAPARSDRPERLFVAPARDTKVTEIQVVLGDVRTADLPVKSRFTHADCPDRTLAMRISGSPAFSPDGDLWVPTLYADTMLFDSPDEPLIRDREAQDTGMPADAADDPTQDVDGTLTTGPNGTVTPGGGADGDEVLCPQMSDTRQQGGRSTPYGESLDPSEVARSPGVPGRFTPAIVRIADLGEEDNGLFGFAVTLGAITQAEFPPGVIDPAIDPNTDPATNPDGSMTVFVSTKLVRSYPSDIAFSTDPADPGLAWVSFPGQGAMMAVRTSGGDTPELARTFQTRDRVAFSMPVGTSALLPVGNNSLLVYNFLERGVAELQPQVLQETFELGFLPLPIDEVVTARWSEPASSLSATLQEGRRLFFTSDDATMAAPDSGVSCETCHVDGRNDGFTWQFEQFPKQTMNLAGRVSDTLPITWTGQVATVLDEVHATNTDRMGGTGVSASQAAAVALWVDHTPEVVRPQPHTDAAMDAVERGAALFHSPAVGCATCHAGAAYTDGRNWTVAAFDFATNTPTLRGIGGSAPYFHDGSAKTLRDVLEQSRDGSMGNTADLSDHDLADLEAYLRTL
ncbi:MAG: c-type cytochrome [Alphaproteobacteria bacterium]|nr:c-type cytochrome [Alphaproteobacteria bacterium]